MYFYNHCIISITNILVISIKSEFDLTYHVDKAQVVVSVRELYYEELTRATLCLNQLKEEGIKTGFNYNSFIPYL